MARIEISYQEYTNLKQQIENLEKELIDKDKLIIYNNKIGRKFN